MAELETRPHSFFRPVSFAACSYCKPDNHYRRKLIKKTFQNWAPLLALPFTERIFLDDRSPDFTASRALASAGMVEKFDRVVYQTIPHPSHSNFGITGSLRLCETPYIFHLDDDVQVVSPPEECFHWIDAAIRVMEADPTIQGVNLGRIKRDLPLWSAGEKYDADTVYGFHHPKELFGMNAGIIRRSLLERVGFDQIAAWGEKQPHNWENLIGKSPKEFLVGTDNMPFFASTDSYFFSSTRSRSPIGWLLFQTRRFLIYLGLMKPPFLKIPESKS